MKVSMASSLAEVPIGSTGLCGKPIVVLEDKLTYVCYEVCLQPGSSHELKSGFGDNYNHIYYVITGKISVSCSDGTEATLDRDDSIAMTGSMHATVECREKARVYAVYAQQASQGPYPAKPKVTYMKDIIGSEREVAFQNDSKSKRLLIKSDNFNITLTNTTINAGETVHMQYKRHVETNYFLEGDILYTWNDGKDRYNLKQDGRAGGEAMNITLDQHEAHVAQGGAVNSVALCVFYPPLIGNEKHDPNNKHSAY